MKRILLLVIAGWSLLLSAWGNEPLKRPLSFIPSDSVVVWGEDRSDFRMSALAVAPELQPGSVEVGQVDRKAFKNQLKEWNREVVPSLNILGAVKDEQGKTDVLGTAALVEKAGILFLQTADRQYMDILERTALNGLMSVATPGELSFEKHVAARALMDVSGMIYATDEEGIFVNLYVNSSTHVKNKDWDFVMDQLTVMPHESRVKLRISGLKKGQTRVKMRLRMPDWAFCGESENEIYTLEGTPKTLPTVYVNGREEFYQLDKGYLVIDRRWNSGDEVYFDFPFMTQYIYGHERKDKNKQIVALQRGPLVYGFQNPVDHWLLQKEQSIKESEVPNAYGHISLSVPVQSAQGESSTLCAEPAMDGAGYLWLNVKR